MLKYSGSDLLARTELGRDLSGPFPFVGKIGPAPNFLVKACPYLDHHTSETSLNQENCVGPLFGSYRHLVARDLN